MTRPRSLKDELEWMAGLGFHLFPISPRTKIPLVKWGTEATDDLDQIRRWWDKRNPPSVGVACTPSKLVVVDVDR